MKIPKVKFSFAPHMTFFYVLGFLSQHGGFGPASEQRIRLLEKRFPSAKKELQTFLKVADDYRLFTQVKRALLHSRSPRRATLHSYYWQNYLASYNKFIKVSAAKLLQLKGKKFVKELSKQWQYYSKTIVRLAKRYQLIPPAQIECFIVPNIGEYGEAFDSTLVLSLDFRDVTIAFAVFLEELVHLSIGPELRKRAEKILPRVSPELQEEALVGVLMNQLLKALNYDDSIRESIVFDWQRGSRAKLIRTLEISFGK